MYSFESRVRYSEVDPSLTMTYPSVINYFQDCSTFQSEELNIGVRFLMEQHRVWLLNSWQLMFHRLPVLGEKIIISTWPYEFKGMLGFRNFLISDEAGVPLVVANSVWVHVNTDTGLPAKLLPEYEQLYQKEPPYPMDYASRKIQVPKELEFQSATPIPVTVSHLDSNHHVNNGQYIAMACSLLPEGTVTALHAEYKKQAFLGDIIYPRLARKDQTLYVLLCNAAGEPYVITEFTLERNEL